MSPTRRTRVYHWGSGTSIGSVLSRVVMFIFGLIELLILIRFMLLLFGANAQAGFAQWINQVSGYFMAPFNALFGTQSIKGATVDWSALVAILVYALVAYLIVRVIDALAPSHRSDTVERVETDEDVKRR
jgi:uncharacterized protein YggT (Ycf19 family)